MRDKKPVIKPVFSFGFSIFSALIAELLATLTGCGYWIASSQPPALSAADLDELRADASVVTITTRYTGAAPAIIDTEMTEIIEGAVARCTHPVNAVQQRLNAQLTSAERRPRPTRVQWWQGVARDRLQQYTDESLPSAGLYLTSNHDEKPWGCGFQTVPFGFWRRPCAMFQLSRD